MIVKLCQYFHSFFGTFDKKGAAFLCAAPKGKELPIEFQRILKYNFPVIIIPDT